MTTQTIMPNPEIYETSPTRKLTSGASLSTRKLDIVEVSLCSMSVAALAARCVTEMDKYRRGEPQSDQYCVELLRRALVQRDHEAWENVQQCFTEVMQRWMHSYPMRELACRHDSEENYIAQAFTRFWIATVVHQKVEFRTVASALRYLRASLNAAVLDTLRAYARPKEMPLPEHEELNGLYTSDQDDAGEVWEVVRSLLLDEREQRVAYLLFHCGLKPREILKHCPEEFSDIQEIYRLRRNITERLARNGDLLRWRLGDGAVLATLYIRSGKRDWE